MTIQERNSIYKKAIIYLSDNFGICGAINCAYKEVNINRICELIDFPELLKYVPEGLTTKHYWFSLDAIGTKKRFEILKQVIVETNGNI